MNAREQYKHLLNFGANFVVLLVEGCCFAYIWYTVYGEVYGFARRGNWAVIGLYLLVTFFFTKTFGGYNIGYLQITDITLSHILSIGLSGITGYLELCLICRSYVQPGPILGVIVVEVLFIIPWIYIIRRLYARLYPPHQMLLIYGDYSPDEMIAKMSTRTDRYNICATVRCTEGYERLFEMIPQYNAVLLYDLPAQERNRIMKFCYQASVRTYVTPKISDILLRGADDIHLFDTPLLLLRNQGLSINQRMVKRAMDIVLSLVGIVIASPFMLIIALAVKLYDGGPVFYRQERPTRDGKSFMIYKFRSMSVDSQIKGTRITSKGDKRVTPVGTVIRSIHFDELPQLLNILKGDMSIVGPRPEWKEMADLYLEKVPEFMLRTKVKAGLTGYAQVYGKYTTTPYDKLKLDLTYIENYSLWLDIKIMLLTVKILFQKEKTEGVNKGQKSAMKEKG